tara:strand:+ start:869 stop:1156 length:288 start_codon:yes stop_codon:yes gene_type:complete
MRFNKHLNIARLILIQLFIMISFAIFYYYIGTSTQDQHFRIVEGKITPLKALYLSIVTQTTVGFGDIAPISPLARIVAMIQMVLGYVVIANILQF